MKDLMTPEDYCAYLYSEGPAKILGEEYYPPYQCPRIYNADEPLEDAWAEWVESNWESYYKQYIADYIAQHPDLPAEIREELVNDL